MAEETTIDTGNYQMVGVSAGNILVMSPKRQMTKAEALVHAAWLVALADESEENADFKKVLDAIYAI